MFVCLTVCPSVRLSNACIVTKRKKDLSRFLYHTKDHLAYSFLRRSDPFYLKSWVNSALPGCSEIADFEPILVRSASAVTYSEKSSINTYKSSLRAFQ